MDRAEAVAFMKRYRYIGMLIETIREGSIEYIDLLRSVSELIGDGNGIRDEIRRERDRIRDQISELAQVKESIEAAVEGIEKDNLRMILRKRYFEGKSLEAIAAEEFIDPVTAYRWSVKALDQVCRNAS